MFITVVVPVYKVEKYIGLSLKSLLGQTFRDFEIILVNDGSPDNSAVIAEKLLSGQTGIPYQIITTENRGVSAARNTGVEKAQGKYVVMVDADDVLSPNFLMCLFNLCQQSPDANIFSCSFSVVSEEQACIFAEENDSVEYLSYEEAQNAFFIRRIKFLLPALMLRISFLREHGIRFDEAVRYSEDVQFIWRCLAYNRAQVIHSRAKYYNYVLHSGSTMTSSGVDKILTFCGGLERLTQEAQEFLCEPVRSQLKTRMYFSMLHGAAKMLEYPDFKILYERSNCKQYIKNQVKEGGILPRTVSLFLITANLFGYVIMRKF